MRTPLVLLDEIIVSDESGFACSKTKLVEDGLIHLRPFNLTNDGALSFAELYKVPHEEAPKGKRMLEEGDILFNNTNSAELVGKAALVEEQIEAGFSNHMTRIRVNKAKAMPQWVTYWLRWMRSTGHFSAHATQWVSQAAFKSSELRRMTMPLPTLEEQRRLVDILSRAEGIVRLRPEAQKKAAELIPALFLDMFGDPATNPKGWPTEPFGLAGTLDRGKSRHRPRDARELYGGPYPFIQTGDVANSGGRIKRYNAMYSELGLAQSKLWPAGTLCITIAANIAKTGVLELDACFPDSVVGFLPSARVRTEYVQAWLGFLQPSLEASAPQAAQKNINLEILRRLPFPIPPIPLQEAFQQQCRDVFSIQTQQDTATKKAEATFDALLSHTFSTAND
jgi:type I restriction enzyme, S subunit